MYVLIGLVVVYVCTFDIISMPTFRPNPLTQNGVWISPLLGVKLSYIIAHFYYAFCANLFQCWGIPPSVDAGTHQQVH